MSDLDEKIREAAEKYPRKKAGEFNVGFTVRTFTAGANFMRELMQDYDAEIQKTLLRRIDFVQAENQKLRDKLAVVDSLLKALSDRHLWSQHCGECICQPHIDVKNYLSKTKGGAE